MSFTNEVKKYVLGECGMDLVGIADPKALANEPVGYRPEDILPGVKSIIVFGKRLIDGAVQTAFRYYEDGRKEYRRSAYGAYCAELAPNFVLLFQTFNVSQYIERLFGKTAVPLPCGPLQNGAPLKTPVSLYSGPIHDGLPMNIEMAALAAGLGEFGWSGCFMTPEYGPRIRFSAVLTTMELDYDSPYVGEKLCDPSKCQVCVNCCPTNAIPAYGTESKCLSVTGKENIVADVKATRCAVAACAMRKEFGGAKDYIDNTDPSFEELAQAFDSMPINHAHGLDHYPKWKCDKCLIYCPVGSWNEKFRDRGLSNADYSGAAEGKKTKQVSILDGTNE